MNKKEIIPGIIASAIGGILLLVSTIFLNAFLSSPPSRAEFDSFKATIIQQNKSIDHRLQKIETKQEKIIDLLFKQQGEKK